MAHAQQAGGVGVGRSTGLSFKTGTRIALSERSLKRAIPVLILVLVIVYGGGAVLHRYQAHKQALASASKEIGLVADLVAARLAAPSSREAGEPALTQRRLSRALPDGATAHQRTILYADGSGVIQASAPLSTPYLERTLVGVLGPDQPLTMLGAGAGVMAITLTDGTKVLATVRTLDDGAGQIAVLQPTGSALVPWQRDTMVLSGALTTTILVLVLLGLAFKWQTVRADEADSTLARMSERLEKALSRGRCGLWDWDLSRGQVHWSQSMLDILGMGSEARALPFGTVADLVHPDDADLYEFANVLVRGEQPVVDMEFRMRHSQGHYVWLRARAEMIESEGAPGPHLVGIAVDITEQKQMAEDTQRANMRLRDAIENISEAFVLWDPDNRLVMCNSKYQQFYRLPGSVVVPGTRYEDVVKSAKEPLVRTRVAVDESARDGASTYEAQLEDRRWLHISERRTKDGGFVSVGIDITPLKEHEARLIDSESELMNTIADLQSSRRTLEHQAQQLVDLAEKYQAEKTRAESANRSKSEFLANMSHELRTPLNAIIGFSEIMQAGLFGELGSEKYAEYARDIHESGQYLLDVINDILDMSKIEAGRFSLDREPLDLGQLVKDSLRIVAAKADENGILLSNRIKGTLPAFGDKRALKQILLNLLSNAVKFTNDGGEILVTGTACEEGLSLTIADTGVGIPSDDVEKLGRPFEQVENQFTKSHRGSGLGLAISRSLVELHGGTLTIESEQGVGTVVTFTLPLAEVEEPAQQPVN